MNTDLKNGIRYEFSFSPKEQFLGSGKLRVNKVFDYTVHWLRKYLAPYATYFLVGEASKKHMGRPHAVNIVHFHGWVEFKAFAGFDIETFHYLCNKGVFTMNEKHPTRSWDEYMYKDRDVFEDYFGKHYILTQKTVDSFSDKDRYVMCEFDSLDCTFHCMQEALVPHSGD